MLMDEFGSFLQDQTGKWGFYSNPFKKYPPLPHILKTLLPFSFSPFKAFREVTGSQMPTEGTLIILPRNSAVLVNYLSLILFFFAF